MYKYISKNNLKFTQNYNYTRFEGVCFMREYLKSRAFLNVKFSKNAILRFKNKMSEFVLKSLENEANLRLLIKTFEINKRLYEKYEMSVSKFSNEAILKPNKMSKFNNIYDYLGFGKALGAAFLRSKNLLFLNTLLKLNDTIISLLRGKRERERERSCRSKCVL